MVARLEHALNQLGDPGSRERPAANGNAIVDGRHDERATGAIGRREVAISHRLKAVCALVSTGLTRVMG